MPEVSIIIPVFNRPRLVREAIDSALGEDREVIVVDDCSTDDTWAVLQTFGESIVRIRLERNSGQAVTRNSGLERANGAYVKFLDSDDMLVAGHLEKELAAAREADADIVVSGWGVLSADGKRRQFNAPTFRSIVDDVLAGRGVPTTAALYRRGATARWDPALRKLADWDFFAQSALGVSRIVTLDGTAYWLREHAGPRVSRTSMLTNAQSHHRILHKLERRLASEGKLTEPRRLRLAQYFYKELRTLSVHDRDAFELALVHIFDLDPRFVPRDEERQRWMRIAARLLGTRNALLVYSFLKRARDSISSATKRSHA